MTKDYTENTEKLAEQANAIIKDITEGVLTDNKIEIAVNSFLSNICAILVLAEVSNTKEIKSQLRDDILLPLEELVDRLAPMKLHRGGLGKKSATLLGGYERMLKSSLMLEFVPMTPSESFLIILTMFYKEEGLEGIYTLTTKNFSDLLSISSKIGSPLLIKYAEIADDCPSLDFPHVALSDVKSDTKNNITGTTLFGINKNLKEYKELAKLVKEAEDKVSAMSKEAKPARILANVSKRLSKTTVANVEVNLADIEKSVDKIFEEFIKNLKAEKASIKMELIERYEKAQKVLADKAAESLDKNAEEQKAAHLKAERLKKEEEEAEKLLATLKPQAKEQE